MRITDIEATGIEPVKKFSVGDLSDLVVIAGPNGVGKSRLINAILNSIRRQDQTGKVHLQISATNDTERQDFQAGNPQKFQDRAARLDTSDPKDAALLTNLLQKHKYRRNFRSSILYYESDRSIAAVKPLAYQFEFPDPWEENVSWDMPFSGLKGRWQDTQHSIFKKIHVQNSLIANRARQLRSEGRDSMKLSFEDPLDIFKDTFNKLLGPKELSKANLQAQQLLYTHEGTELPINALSSGEREVLNIAFDFLLRKPSDCVVFFDEPELHLHPELLFRLINTLRSLGERNQFILVTHSPDVISSSLDDSVIFLTPPKNNGDNQAVILRPDAEESEALHRLGQSIGVIALGKKIVLIEGKDSSLDKQTYSHILDGQFNNLVLLPSGGKGNLTAFNSVADGVLNRSIWGVEFFMLADRDAAPDDTSQNIRFKSLSRYHLENYFLDSAVLAKCFEDMEEENSWLRSEDRINDELREIARGSLSYATALIVSRALRLSAGNITAMPKGCDKMARDDLIGVLNDLTKGELTRIGTALKEDTVAQMANDTYNRLEGTLTDGSWRRDFPGKPILKKLSARAKVPEGRLKTLYLTKAKDFPVHPMQEIIDIFRYFAKTDAD